MYDLRLYVAGQSPRSVRALENLRVVCDEHLAGRYRVEVIDLLVNPALARGDEIIAVPTLVRKLPEPIRKIIGDLSDTDEVLVGLQVRPWWRQPRDRERRAARRWMLTLYVNGASPRSAEAIETVRTHLRRGPRGARGPDRRQRGGPSRRVLEDHILALPTLVKHSPIPLAPPGRQPD